MLSRHVKASTAVLTPLVFAAVLVGFAVMSWLAGWPLGVDSAVYRAAALALLHGEPLYGHLSALPTWSPELPFLYPPFAALVFLPLAALPVQLAWGLMASSSVAAIWAVLRLFRPARRSGGWELVALLGAVLVLEPVWRGLGLGQVNLVLMALVALDVLALRGSRWCGILVGLAAAIKLTPLLFVGHLLVTGRKADAARAGGTFAAAALVGTLVLPGESGRFWTTVVHADHDEIDKSWSGNQSSYGFLARTVAADRLVVLWAVLAAMCVAVAVFLVRALHRRSDHAGALLVAAGCALLVSPISWTHHWVWVVPLTARLVMARQWVSLSAVVFLFTGWNWPLLPSGAGSEHTGNLGQIVLGNVYPLAAVTAALVLAWRLIRRPVTTVGTPLRRIGVPRRFTVDLPPERETAGRRSA